MSQLQIILGNQLFPVSFYKNSTKIFMSEDYDLCSRNKMHKHKIIFFLGSMRNFRDELVKSKKKVHYFTLNKKQNFFSNLQSTIKNENVKELVLFEVEDKFFEEEIKDFAKKNKVLLNFTSTPMFITKREEFHQYCQKSKKLFMKTFYEEQRRKFNILMTEEGKPMGGKFSFDAENRKKIPQKYDVIKNKFKMKFDQNTLDVMEMVNKLFSHHPGDADTFWMCVSRKQALSELGNFTRHKLDHFGEFEDAIDNRDPFLYHSVLSPYLNIGFLTPLEVVNKVIATDAPINSKEGFVRQVIGWREFIRGVYQEHSTVQESSNYFNHQRKLTKSWWEGTTGIDPLDDAILKANQFGYCHHIERLMILSNMMLLCEIHPHQVHEWFMQMFVDSSDWVMGPNVYGMGQFSDGGLFATKPYICSSNYIKKMSHYKMGKWCEVMDGLYWRFIHKNKSTFEKNMRMKMMVRLLEKMDSKKLKQHINVANEFLKKQTINK